MFFIPSNVLLEISNLWDYLNKQVDSIDVVEVWGQDGEQRDGYVLLNSPFRHWKRSWIKEQATLVDDDTSSLEITGVRKIHDSGSAQEIPGIGNYV